jgi:hypothetical protein
VRAASAEWQEYAAPSIRQEAEVSDAREASWEHVFEKAAQEDLMSECHRPALVVMSVVLPAERYVSVSKIDEPVVGDCDAVRVSRQIVQNVFGTTEGTLRIHHPVFAKQRPQKPLEGGLVRQRKACAIKSC